MNDFVSILFGTKSSTQVLQEEAAAIKRVGKDQRILTFDAKEESGYVTARSNAIPVEEVQKRKK